MQITIHAFLFSRYHAVEEPHGTNGHDLGLKTHPCVFLSFVQSFPPLFILCNYYVRDKSLVSSTSQTIDYVRYFPQHLGCRMTLFDLLLHVGQNLNISLSVFQDPKKRKNDRKCRLMPIQISRKRDFRFHHTNDTRSRMVMIEGAGTDGKYHMQSSQQSLTRRFFLPNNTRHPHHSIVELWKCTVVADVEQSDWLLKNDLIG